MTEKVIQKGEELKQLLTKGDTVFVYINKNWVKGYLVRILKYRAKVRFNGKDDSSPIKEIEFRDLKYGDWKDVEAELMRRKEEMLKRTQEYVFEELGTWKEYATDIKNKLIEALSKSTNHAVYDLKWHADTLFERAYYERISYEVLDLLCENTVVKALELMQEHLIREQLCFRGNRSTSKMEHVREESEADARIKIIDKFKWQLIGLKELEKELETPEVLLTKLEE